MVGGSRQQPRPSDPVTPIQPAGPSRPASQPQARFRSGTDLVQVDVSVLDGKRRPVRGLTAADFTVFEDGQPRPVEVFTEVDLPPRMTASPSATWTKTVPPDVISNQTPEEGRLVVILMDRSIPVGLPTITARKIAAAAVQEMGPADLAAVVSTSGGIPQNLTADRGRLLRAIDRDWSQGNSPEVREIEESLGGFMQWTGLNDGRCNCGLCVLNTITNIANALGNIPGRRKVLLFIGSDLTLMAPVGADPASDIGCSWRVKESRNTMTEALDRSGLTMHALDPTGLEVASTISRASSTVRGAAAAGARTRDVDEMLQRQGAISVLPARTGGRTVANTNAPEALMPAIFTESQSYYLIGFRPGGARADGSTHAIEIKVNRKGVRVHTRKSYEEPAVAVTAATAAAAGPTSLDAALRGLLPASSVALDLSVAPFATPEGNDATVAFVVGLGTLGVRQGTNERIDIVTSAFDRSGQPRGSARHSLQVAWPAGGDIAAGQRITLLSRLALGPGDYEFRVAVAGSDPVRAGSVFTQALVPAFGSDPLSLSGIVLGATGGTATLPPAFLENLLPVVPTAQRTFTRSGSVLGFLRVYQGTARRDPVMPVQVRARVIDASDRNAIEAAFVMPESEFQATRSADCRITLPVGKLAPGEYLLSVDASMGGRVAGRALRFTVR